MTVLDHPRRCFDCCYGQSSSPRRVARVEHVAMSGAQSERQTVPVACANLSLFSRPGLHLLRGGEDLSLHDALAFFDINELIHLDIFHRVHLTAGPANLEQVDLVGLADSKMNPKIAL